MYIAYFHLLDDHLRILLVTLLIVWNINENLRSFNISTMKAIIIACFLVIEKIHSVSLYKIIAW